MKLQKQNIGVWVKASEELPDKHDRYATKSRGGTIRETEFDIEKGLWINYHSSVVEWLKPVEQVYVLTEDELKNIYNKGFSEGMKEHTHFNGGLSPNQFIQSITQ